MIAPEEKKALEQVRLQLSNWMRIPLSEIDLLVPLREDRRFIDGLITAGNHKFVVEYKRYPTSQALLASTEQLLRFKETNNEPNLIPLIVFPYIGPHLSRLANQMECSWMDLSGNADIVGNGLCILVQGHPNLYRAKGRPKNVFSPKRSRIVRYLLQHPDTPRSQADIAEKTDMSRGFTSQCIKQLMAEGYLVISKKRFYKTQDPKTLFVDWHNAYVFEKHRIIKGHIPARTGEELTGQISAVLAEQGTPHAFTGLAAAWQYSRFAMYRTSTVYLTEEPSDAVLERLSFREDPRGANTWLVIPNDEGVLQGATQVDGVQVVHPQQAYLDLKGHSERAAEAAERLREERIEF